MSDVDNEMLVQPFDVEEFSLAVKQMHKDKAPGSDEFNPALYEKFWRSIGPNIVNSCVIWLETGVFLDTLNNTNVALIYKC